ncbi:hypothetical protein OG203_40385 [Nocardia sp. NBC_01499]|uniref:DUF6879 family protein n=1 Tax=Nocardia sp. NBC_01499 TaxID=2903597 RepID=UPI0038707F30
MQYRPADEPNLWPRLFSEAQRYAFHLEQRDSYAEPAEAERIKRYLAGATPPDSTNREWPDLIHEATGRDVTVSRVRVVTVPHTDYHRWLLSVTNVRVADGEDIRYLPRHLAGEVPPDDWWLFDGAKIAYNLANETGGPAGLAITADPWITEYCEDVKVRLWNLAIPYAEYVKSDFARQ